MAGASAKRFPVSSQRCSRAAVMANAFDDLAVPIHLAQLALSLGGIATVDHQIVDNQANASLNTEAVFR